MKVVKVEIKIEGEEMQFFWEGDNIEWMTWRTVDLADCLAKFAKDKDGTFDVVIVLRTVS